MDFKDPMEREKVLGPLFATEAKAAIPLFGSDRLTSISTKSIVDAAVKKALGSTADAVIDLAAPEGSTTSNVAPDTLRGPLDQLSISKSAKQNGDDTDAPAPSLFSSQELHDRSHYSSFAATSSTPSRYNLMVNTMLRRAKEGYLLNPTLNKAIIQDDSWLRDVWDWIDGRTINSFKVLQNDNNVQVLRKPQKTGE